MATTSPKRAKESKTETVARSWTARPILGSDYTDDPPLQDVYVGLLKRKQDISTAIRTVSALLPGFGHLKRCSSNKLLLAPVFTSDLSCKTHEPSLVEGGSTQNKDTLSQDERRSSQDKGTLSQDEDRSSQDKVTLSQDEGRLYQDEGRLSQDKGGLTQDEGKLAQGEDRLAQDEGGLSQDEGTLSQDEGTLTQNQGILIQNQGILIQKKGSLTQGGDRLVQNEGRLAQDEGTLSQGKGTLSQDEDRLTQNKGGLTQNKGTLSQGKGTLSQDEDRLAQNKGGLTQNKGTLSQGKGTLSQDEDRLAQNKGGLTQNKGTLSQDEDRLAQNKGGLTQNKGTLSQGKGTLSQDEDKSSQDKGGLTQDESTLSQDESRLSQNKDRLAQNEGTLSQNESTLTQDKGTLVRNKGTLTQDELKSLLKAKGFDLTLLEDDFEVVKVPARAAKTKSQSRRVSRIWPVNFHPDPDVESLIDGSIFTEHQLDLIERYMTVAVEATRLEATGNDNCNGSSVIVDPEDGRILAIAASRIDRHPMWHAAMLAVDLVAELQGGGAWKSRESLERNATESDASGPKEDHGESRAKTIKRKYTEDAPLRYPRSLSEIRLPKEESLKSLASRRGRKNNKVKTELTETIESVNSSKCGPYLCTGYWTFLTMEPCPLCAMALVHSRVSRIFYGVPNRYRGVLGSKTVLHAVPGLNHRYRVWSGVLEQECRLALREAARRDTD